MLSNCSFWRPGPYADYGDQLLYHQGFVIVQNMMDEAIMKTHHQQKQNNNRAGASPFNRIGRKMSEGVTSDENNKWQKALDELKQVHDVILGSKKNRENGRPKRSTGEFGRSHIKFDPPTNVYFNLLNVIKLYENDEEMDNQISLQSYNRRPKTNRNAIDKLIELRNEDMNSYYLRSKSLQQHENRLFDSIRVKRSDMYAAQNLSHIVDPAEELESLLKMSIYTVQQPYPCYNRDMLVLILNYLDTCDI